MSRIGLRSLPKGRKAVLVGTALSPGQPNRSADGFETRTLWGELAYQLGKTEGYAMVAQSDQAGISPGSDVERLFSVLVSPFAEIRRASSQRQFEASFGKALKDIVLARSPIGRIEEIGTREIDGVPMTIGFRTIVTRKRTLWRPVSLQALDTPEKQLTGAKAAALDIFTTRTIPEYRTDAHVVALQQPKTQSSERLEEVIACLKKATDTVLIGADSETLGQQVPALLA